MEKFSAFLEKLKYGILLLFIFVLPFSFFLNLSQINIVYILAFSTILLPVISFVQFLISKKITLHTGPLDTPIIIFLGGLLLSFLIISTNKIQAFLDPNMGLMMIVVLSVFYFYGRQYAQNRLFSSVLSLSAFIISSIVIILSLEPLKNLDISLDLIIFFGFMFIYMLGLLLNSFSEDDQKSKVIHICILAIISIALIISLVSFFKQQSTLVSFSLSVKSLLETVKNPLTAIFGVGIDNYSTVFTRIKDIGFNQTDLWQFPAPNVDRSTLFHIATTTGVVGLISFLYLLFSLIKKIFFPADKKGKQNFSIMLSFIYLLCILVLLPPSLLVFFLAFFLAGQTRKNNKEHIFNLSKSFSSYSYFIIIATACILFGAAVRYIGTIYMADYFYAQSLAGMKENSFKKVYDNQQKALSYGPYLEQYHLGFARTHFVLTQNILDRVASESAKSAESTKSAEVNTQSDTKKPLVFTKESQQMLVEAIQMAITENQRAIDLNPKKAEYWAGLAQVYTIIPKELQPSEDKDANSPQTIAINLYKKSLELDPNNPIYYFSMGQAYLMLQKPDDAFQNIKKAVELKPNWADAHYQLAMMYGQNNDKDNMVKELEATLQYLDSKNNQKEYDAINQLLNKIKDGQSGNQTPPQNQRQPSQNQGQPPAGQQAPLGPPPQTNNLPASPILPVKTN